MAGKRKMNPRGLMELAVKVMKDSECEPRDDGKETPLVGAVLLKPDGQIETACRGELRDGDHAEFTLLERKNRHCRLDGSILFATLEPCAPGARKPPKTSCAERIVLARIKQVWIGIADPDPKVDRKGIKYLQDHGVVVQMFDRDLQEEIHNANRKFIDQANERAEAEEEKIEEVKLSWLEDGNDSIKIDNFSKKALEYYRYLAKIVEKTGTPEFYHRLGLQGLLKKENGAFVPTGFGVLLFGKEPQLSMPHARLLGTIHYPDGTEEPQNFEGPMVLVPDQVEKWLKDKLPNVIDRTTMQRQEIPALSFEMVREAIVNALIHRDYDIRAAKCQLIVSQDTIVVKSPGAPIPPITLEQLQSFQAPMLSRNPELHYVFSSMGMAEERGLGLKSLKNRAQETGLPLPRYSWEDPYMVLTLFRNPMAALPEDARNSFADMEIKGWKWLVKQGFVTSSEYAKALSVDSRTARRHFQKFAALSLLQPIGAGPSSRYSVMSPNKVSNLSDRAVKKTKKPN